MPDAIFRDAAHGQFDAVLAMYHDQGLIPLKLLDFDTAVNVTLGLPKPRTSPDHGTAFSIAGKRPRQPVIDARRHPAGLRIGVSFTSFPAIPRREMLDAILLAVIADSELQLRVGNIGFPADSAGVESLGGRQLR